MDIGDLKYLKPAPRRSNLKKLLLSEAILIGSVLHPQGRKYFFDDGKTCALGAAAVAVGIPRNRVSVKRLKEHFEVPLSVLMRVVYENDELGLPRHVIAKLLERDGY